MLSDMSSSPGPPNSVSPPRPSLYSRARGGEAFRGWSRTRPLQRQVPEDPRARQDAMKSTLDRPSCSRRTPLLLAGLVLCGAALAACGGDDGSPAVGPREGTGHPMVGHPAPDFVGEPPVGGWLPLRNLKDKPVAILFYRPGAPFTRELAAAFKGFRADPSMAPTVFLGIANDTMDDIKRFNEQTGDALPTLRDPGNILRDYAVGDQPTVILLDSRRLVRYRMDGFAGRHFRERVADVAEALRRLPANETPAAEALPIEYSGHPKA